MAEHIVSPKIYLRVFFGLLALTALTTGVAFIDLGRVNTIAALVIAVCKACLVVLFFMHLRYQPGLTRVVLVAGLFWLMLLIGGTLQDIKTRGWTPHPTGWGPSIAAPPSDPTQDSP